MSYRRVNKKNSWWFKLAPFFGLLVFLLVAGFLFKPLTRPTIWLIDPIWRAGDNLSSGLINFFGLIRTKNNLENDNRSLRADNEKLRSIVLAKNQIEADNTYLRRLFGQQNKKTALPVVAQVIFLPDLVPYNSLQIDLGVNNLSRALRVGDLATVGNAVLIGRVAEIGPNYSKIKLLSAENNLPVVIGPKNIPAVASGSGAGNFSVVLPKDAVVEVNDRVIVPALGGRLLGVVGGIDSGQIVQLKLY